MEEKKCKKQEMKVRRGRSMPKRGKCYSLGLATLFGGSSEKFTEGERRVERGIKLFRAGGPAELTQVVPGSATQYLWPSYWKERPQVVGIDRCPLLGKRAVGNHF